MNEYYCPHHNVRLVLKTSSKGRNAGKQFWGCPTWCKTKCKYTIPFESEKIEPTIKEKLLNKIRNKNGKISVLKIIGTILMIPIYILISFISFNSSARKRRF